MTNRFLADLERVAEQCLATPDIAPVVAPIRGLPVHNRRTGEIYRRNQREDFGDNLKTALQNRWSEFEFKIQCRASVASVEVWSGDEMVDVFKVSNRAIDGKVKVTQAPNGEFSKHLGEFISIFKKVTR